jgi:hypothetical protein
MTFGRRRFLQAMFGAACGVVLGDEVLDTLDRLAPRPTMVPGAEFAPGYYGTLANADINRIWRKVQADLYAQMRFECEEWRLMEDVKMVNVSWTAREMVVPIMVRA